MKVLLVNGSPREKGCTYTALSEVAKSLKAGGVEPVFYSIGKKPVHGCIECGKCKETGKCVFDDDVCNELLGRMQQADGIVVGSPVFYAGPNGALCAVLDRIFYCGAPTLANKPAAAVVSCRRGGASATFDRLNKYFMMSRMPIVTSQYWNSVHGNTPDEVRRDLEGLQTMRTLGRNMVWLLQSIRQAKLSVPKQEPWIATSFIR